MSAEKKTGSARARVLRSGEGFRELGLFVFIVILCVAFQLRNHSFLTLANIKDLLDNTAILGILSVGMMLVLITGGIDLSIGATIALAGMTSALTGMAIPTINPLLSILEGMAVGLVIGSLIGLLVARFKVLPIIATLGIMNIVRGVTYIESKGAWVSAYQMSDGFKALSTGTTSGVNNLVLIALVIFVLFWYFVNHTKTGRRIYAIGSNPEAADVSGIPRRKLLWLVYAIMGVLAGLGGRPLGSQVRLGPGRHRPRLRAQRDCGLRPRGRQHLGRIGQGVGPPPRHGPAGHAQQRAAPHRRLALLAAVHPGHRHPRGRSH